MFDIGWQELLLVGVLALLVLGPKELSRTAFMIGNFFSQARAQFAVFRNAFEDMAEDLESASKNQINPPRSLSKPPPAKPQSSKLKRPKRPSSKIQPSQLKTDKHHYEKAKKSKTKQ